MGYLNLTIPHDLCLQDLDMIPFKTSLCWLYIDNILIQGPL